MYACNGIILSTDQLANIYDFCYTYVQVPSSSDTALTESQGEESVASVNGNVDEPKRLVVAAEDAALVDSKLPKPKSRFTVKMVPKEVTTNK